MTPYYEADGIVIYHGDCRDILPHVSADAGVTDPPYGVNLGAHVSANEARRERGSLHKPAYGVYQDTRENFHAVVVPAIKTMLTRTKRAAVFSGHKTARYLPEPSCIGGIFHPAGSGLTSWGFTNLMPCLFYGSSPQRGSYPTMISSTAGGVGARNDHPCPKPLAWMMWLVGLATVRGESLIDPFMGSGTTLLAAKEHGRCAIGIEIEERYCEIAAERLAQQVLFAM